MRILHIIDSLGAGGKERQLVELLKGLQRKKGVECELVVLSDRIHSPYFNGLDVTIHFLERRIKKDPTVFLQLHRVCKQVKPDIIHCWDSMCSVYAAPCAKTLGIKFIDGVIRDAPLKVKRCDKFKILSRLTFSLSDFVLSNSRAGLKSYKAPRHKSFCIHNGFDLSRICTIQDPRKIRQNYNIHSKKIVGMVANFTARKDHETYIRASLQILKNREDVTFLTVGEGSTQEKSREIIQPEFRDGIRFLGKKEDVESIVNVFDVGVLATYTEGISNSILEYMALAKPVVATECEGTSEVVVHNRTGFLVPPADADEMADKIEFLLNNDQTAKAMGKAGRERVIREFSIDKMTDQHIALYEKCIGHI